MTDVTPDITITPPCIGAAGSQPFLDDVENQLSENYHAERESRKPKILPIQCRLCNGYHEVNQLNAATVFPGTQFEEYAYNRIAPRPDSHTYVDQSVLTAAHMAVNGGHNPFVDVPEDNSDGSE